MSTKTTRLTFDDLPRDVQMRAIDTLESIVVSGKEFLESLSPAEKTLFEDAFQNVALGLVQKGVSAYLNPLVNTEDAIEKVITDMATKSPFIQCAIAAVGAVK